MGEPLAHVPFRSTRFMARDLVCERRADGVVLLSTRIEPRIQAQVFPWYLRRFAKEKGEAPLLSAREAAGGAWRTIRYDEAASLVASLTQALLDHADGSNRPLAILSGNSIEHALLMFASMQAGIPVAPLAPGYSLLGNDFGRLRAVIDLLEPQFLFAQEAGPFAKAIDAIGLRERKLITAGRNEIEGALDFGELTRTPATGAVQHSFDALDPDHAAKIMMTSGSTGSPKGVIHTHRTLCATIETSAQVFGMHEDSPPVRLDWLPWNHVAGAVAFGTVLATGGHYYIDNGKPTPDAVEESIGNLKSVIPTHYGNVPIGYSALVTAFERDPDFARRFFSSVEYLAYAGAQMPEELASKIQALAVAATGFRMPIASAFGSTETGPTGAFVHWPTDRTGLIGLPMPGVVLKLTPFEEERYELRIKGPGVMKAYYKVEARTRDAFDEEGFYCFGDLVAFADPDDLHQGLLFAGRILEEFKLQTGVFVRSGALRADVLSAAAPLLQAAVVCGQDQPFVGLLAWPNVEQARAKFNLPDAGASEIVRDPRFVEAVARAIAQHNRANPASSTRIARFMLMDRPLNSSKGEITDKGEINSRAVQKERAAEVDALFADAPPNSVHVAPVETDGA